LGWVWIFSGTTQYLYTPYGLVIGCPAGRGFSKAKTENKNMKLNWTTKGVGGSNQKPFQGWYEYFLKKAHLLCLWL